jgi:hypothetical protein
MISRLVPAVAAAHTTGERANFEALRSLLEGSAGSPGVESVRLLPWLSPTRSAGRAWQCVAGQSTAVIGPK